MSAIDDFYLAQAAACGEAADKAVLENQRQIFLNAQRAWDALAKRTAQIASDRAARLVAQTVT